MICVLLGIPYRKVQLCKRAGLHRAQSEGSCQFTHLGHDSHWDLGSRSTQTSGLPTVLISVSYSSPAEVALGSQGCLAPDWCLLPSLPFPYPLLLANGLVPATLPTSFASPLPNVPFPLYILLSFPMPQ